MRIDVVALSYSLMVSISEFCTITHRDIENGFEDNLGDRLEKIDGVECVEYDGHFGPHIFFRVDAHEDQDQAQEAVLEAVEQFIGGN